MNYPSHNPEETQRIGSLIASEAKMGDTYLLYGELGAGKTTFTKGFLSYFGIDERSVVSPTFTLMQIYDIPDTTKMLIHIDAYRLERQEELVEIGALDYLGKEDTISLIEWPEKIGKYILNLQTTKIEIQRITESERIIIKN